MFKFSYKDSRIKSWICSKICIANFKFIDYIDQRVQDDFVHVFCTGLPGNPKVLTSNRIARKIQKVQNSKFK